MNCQTIRTRILALPDPAELPAALTEHLAGCPGCVAWHRRALLVEAAVANVPVPATDGTAKARLVARFRTESKSKSKAPALVASPARGAVARWWPLGLVAAAVLVGTIAVLTFERRPNTEFATLPPDPLLEKVVAAKIELDAAPFDRPRKLQVLTRLGDDLHDQAQALARVAPGAEMESLAKMYASVGDSIVAEAREVSPDQARAALEPCIRALTRVEQEASKKATEAPVGSSQPLLDIARVAKASRTELAKRL